jgi:GWxTD domain-containing protein
MSRICSALFLLTLLFSGLPPTVTAQEQVVPQSSLVINFDYARFRDTDSTEYLELYFACFPQLVTVGRTADGFAGYLNLSITFREKSGGTGPEPRRAVIPVLVKDTSGAEYRNTLVTQMGLMLGGGSYVMTVLATDSLAPSRRDSVAIEFAVGRPSSGITTSDIELCSNIRRSTNTGDPFYKNSHEVVPNPTLLFGSVNYPVIFHYVELYGLDPGQTYTIKTVLADAGGKPLQETSRQRKYGVINAVEVGTTNATKLASGKYRFQLYILDALSRPLARTEKSFYTYNPQMAAPTVSEGVMQETALTGLTAEELDQEFEYARYHATQDEIRTFSQITSESGKREFLGTFWSGVAAGKLGHSPITRAEYLLRVKRSNDRYRALSREGWKTDRGRVLLLYGEPDEIDRHPSSERGKPYEMWNFFQVENGVVFIFVDRTGFGDYVLVHSTKRGELRDDDWQRLLQ